MSVNPNLTNIPVESGVVIGNATATGNAAGVNAAGGINVEPIYVGPPVGSTQGSDATLVTFAGGAKLTKLTAVSTDTTQIIYVQISKVVGAITILVGDPVAIPVATAKGSFNSSTVDLMAALYAGGPMNLGAGAVLQAQLSVAPAAGKTVTVSVEGAAF